MWKKVIQTRFWAPNGKPLVKNWKFKTEHEAKLGKQRLEMMGLEIVNEFTLVKNENEWPERQKSLEKNSI